MKIVGRLKPKYGGGIINEDVDEVMQTFDAESGVNIF